jgi:1-phosphatidylinositol-3-phosphate 5-kinase
LKKPLLPTYIDPEEAESNEDKLGEAKESDIGRSRKDFWMPDRLCKVCYGCEDAFTMYRRRHHCRMCGQVFCNPCSSFYIDGAMINMQGPVRACRLCHDQLQERATAEIDNKQYRPRRELSLVRSRSQSNCIEEYRGATVNPTGPEPDDINSTGEGLLRGGKLTESLSQKLYHTNNLQNR